MITSAMKPADLLDIDKMQRFNAFFEEEAALRSKQMKQRGRPKNEPRVKMTETETIKLLSIL